MLYDKSKRRFPFENPAIFSGREIDPSVPRFSVGVMDDASLAKWQKQLALTQTALGKIGPMRPGTLTQQYKDPATKTGAYWQLSYTHQMRSRTRYVRPDDLADLRPQLANFKRFRLLVDRCVDLSVKIADRQTELRRRQPAAPKG